MTHSKKTEGVFTTIKVSANTRDDLMLFKIYTKSKSLEETILKLIEIAKRRTSEDNPSVSDVFNILKKGEGCNEKYRK
jgi:hypothetical protein|tara:strand:+ start:41 stop:274 length:234 start_codon:yes stop_codon:yes gene_type:complete